MTLYDFLINEKGYTEAEAEETVFRYEYSLEKPEQVKKDIHEYNEKFYIKFVKD